MWTIESHSDGAASIYDDNKFVAVFPLEEEAVRACVAVNSDSAKIEALEMILRIHNEQERWCDCTICEQVHSALAKSGV
jgi:hypothetical protein